MKTLFERKGFEGVIEESYLNDAPDLMEHDIHTHPAFDADFDPTDAAHEARATQFDRLAKRIKDHNEQHTSIIKNNAEACGLIRDHLCPAILETVAEAISKLTSVPELFDFLDNIYGYSNKANVETLCGTYEKFKMLHHESARCFINRFKTIVDSLLSAGRREYNHPDLQLQKVMDTLKDYGRWPYNNIRISHFDTRIAEDHIEDIDDLLKEMESFDKTDAHELRRQQAKAAATSLNPQHSVHLIQDFEASTPGRPLFSIGRGKPYGRGGLTKRGRGGYGRGGGLTGSDRSEDRDFNAGDKRYKCEHCHKPGHIKANCFKLYPHKRGENQRRSSRTGDNDAGGAARDLNARTDIAPNLGYQIFGDNRTAPHQQQDGSNSAWKKRQELKQRIHALQREFKSL